MENNKKYEYLFIGFVIGLFLMAFLAKFWIDSDYVLKSHVAAYKSVKQIRQDMPKN